MNPRFKFPPLNKITLGIFIVNGALWLFFIIGSYIFGDWSQSLYLSLALQPNAVLEGHVYKLFTYAFLHDLRSPFHLLLNMLLVYFFSSVLLHFRSKMTALLWAATAAIVGGVFCLLFWAVGGIFGEQNPMLVVGFSSVAMFMLTLFCLRHREATILLFFVLPMKAMTLLYIALGIDFLMWISIGGDVAFPAHLGGAATAFVLYYWESRRLKRRKSKYRVKLV